MGIPGFNVWFSEKYAKAYVPLGRVRVDHLYIDLNSVLHTVMRRARNHNHFHKLLHKRLHSILDVTGPTKSVMIAVDGPAPLAKLLTQRDRRKKTGRSVDEGETLTGVAITPGTTFMLDLTHSLTYYCCTKMASKRFRDVVFELSDGTVKGEGEVKVLGRLARHWYPEDPNDTHVILGDDADLILMALTSYKENLFVANSGLNDGRLDTRVPVFSVNLLHQQWARELVAGVVAGGQVPLESALLHAKLDLTLIAILTKGNDYLPGLRGASLEGGSRSGLWPGYQAAVGKHKGAAGGPLGPQGSITSIDPDTGAPRLDASALARLLALAGVGGGADGRGGDEWRGSKAAADPQAYLRGCVWLLQMYLTGECPDYRFYYDGVAPTAAAIKATCEAAVSAGHRYIHLDTFGQSDPRAAQPLLPVACALALLPSNCRHLAAPCVRHLMASPSPAQSRAASEDGSGSGADGPASASQPAAPGGGFDAEVYYQLYGDCSVCRSMTADVARLQKELASARAERNAANNRLEAVRAGTAPFGEPPEEQLVAELDELDRKCEAAKSQLNACETRRRSHVASAHPYQRFPVEKLEEAAGT
ncbi:hypothetical protein GPECTOR_12g550 [Gonium pectorale]|uniref:Xrn1 N-terminal domain-containing protein n=1 Tax=Gonium pectorale TaxID=33097 RepID=A0A150GP34_GONPE|nr:hypothetical protein GPECTOR_12g550 [Gonium pectorale]|eukprot:KXZ51587.1 hypothetical protein GPECTOR_12g550 [Gonium pectorale]